MTEKMANNEIQLHGDVCYLVWNNNVKCCYGKILVFFNIETYNTYNPLIILLQNYEKITTRVTSCGHILQLSCVLSLLGK